MQKTHKYTLRHLFPPTFATFGDQKYMMPGWIPVDPDTTWDDVLHINPFKDLEKKEYEVQGSRGNSYTVTVIQSDGTRRITCTCPAGKFRGKCKHMKSIEDQLDI